MAKLIFEDKFNSLSTRQQEFLREILQSRGYTDNKVLIETVGSAGDNYIANVKRIIVKEKDGGTFKIIAKVAPTNEMSRALIQAQLLFSNEAVMYNKVLPKLVELQKIAGVPGEGLLRYAECYGSMLDAPDEIILLEDLQVSNFIMLDRFTSLSNECIKMNLKNFAILHSLSMVLKKQKPDLYESISQELIDYYSIFDGSQRFLYFLASIEKDLIAVLDKDEYKNAVRGSVSKMLELSKKMLKDESSLDYLVAIQGDAWTNNIMYKMKEDIPVKAIMIDYQLSKISNPVCDILYMIFNCTDYVTRREHYHDWIEYYYLQLEESLAKFGIKADLLFSRNQLDTDLKRYSKLLFANSIMLASVLIRKPEDAAKLKKSMEIGGISAKEDLGNMKVSNMDEESISVFKRRIERLVDSYRDLGYIS
ncbi:uncharacterized protein ACR2FA_012775 [Aphomia sociella]